MADCLIAKLLTDILTISEICGPLMAAHDNYPADFADRRCQNHHWTTSTIEQFNHPTVLIHDLVR